MLRRGGYPDQAAARSALEQVRDGADPEADATWLSGCGCGWPAVQRAHRRLHQPDSGAHLCEQGHLTGQPALFDRGDDDFHLGIATASHNPFLLATVREARRLQRQSSTIGLHGVIGSHAAEAIRAGDPAAAAEATGVHLDKTLEEYRREIQRRVFG